MTRITIYTAAALVAAPILTARWVAHFYAVAAQAALVAVGLAEWEDFR